MSVVKQMQAIRSIATEKGQSFFETLKLTPLDLKDEEAYLLSMMVSSAFLTFQLELLEKEEGEKPNFGDAVEYGMKLKEAEPLSFDLINGKRACFYFYPQDISEAKEGDRIGPLDANKSMFNH